MADPTLADTLRRALATHPDGALHVGFSGGPDSTALLHALANLPGARARGLRAVHVDHGLHADSHAWAERCKQFCADIDIPLDVHPVRVDGRGGMGLEAAAREARYAAFAQALPPGANLLTAHHRDDQAETVLLKLLRGAGPEGLGGMRERRPFADGWLWRPLLDTPRDALVDHLRAHGLDGIDDPSNQSTDLTRNFLRLEILPRLTSHWPQSIRSINHSARLNRQADDYLQARAGEALESLLRTSDRSLDAHGWLALHPALQGPALDQWLHAQGFTSPTLAQRKQLQCQIEHASGGRVPLVQWPGAAVHVWRGRLHAHRPLPDIPPGWKTPWHGETLHLPGAAGTLRLLVADPGQAATVPALEVRLGETGIHLRPAGDRHTRELRDLFQHAGVPPWQRRRCPLVYAADGTLLAVAGLCCSDAGKTLFERLGGALSWHPCF